MPGILLAASIHLCAGSAFEGQIRAEAGRSGAANWLLYTVSTNRLRVEVLDTNAPNAVDLVELDSGQVTLLMPMNRTFMRFKPGATAASGFPAGFPGQPSGAPFGFGPQTQPGSPGAAPMPPRPPAGIGPTNLAGFTGVPAMPALPTQLPPGIGPAAGTMPSAPPIPAEPARSALELQATGETETILGYRCGRYEIKGRGETMEIWATDQLVPFQPYLPAQPPGFGPPLIEYQWSNLVREKKLFPLRAVLRAENGRERYRFQVQAITPGVLTETQRRGFAAPESYVEVQPRPF